MAEAVKSGLLSLPDKVGATKRMIEDVLNDFDVTYNWSNHNNARVLSVEIWISNKRLTHTVSITDQNVNFALKRADLRQKLVAINAPRKRLPLPINPAIPGVLLSTPVAADRLNLLTSTAIPSPEIISSDGVETPVLINPEPELVETVDTILEADSQSAASSQDSGPVFPSPPPDVQKPEPAKIDSRLVYTTSMLKATEVMVIDLPKGLIVTEHSVLIVPIHDPTLLTSMPKAQFQALFHVVPNDRADTKPVEVTPPVKPKAKTLDEILPIVEPAPPIVFPSKADQSEPIQRKKSKAKLEPISTEIRSFKGVTAQIARHMAAVAYVQRKGKSTVVVRDLVELLDEHDYKQVSARMPKAVALNYAIIHNKDSRPLQYSITQAGFDLLAALHSWPWKRDNLAMPSWAESLSIT